jgi:hypothetical protein
MAAGVAQGRFAVAWHTPAQSHIDLYNQHFGRTDIAPLDGMSRVYQGSDSSHWGILLLLGPAVTSARQVGRPP